MCGKPRASKNAASKNAHMDGTKQDVKMFSVPNSAPTKCAPYIPATPFLDEEERYFDLVDLGIDEEYHVPDDDTRSTNRLLSWHNHDHDDHHRHHATTITPTTTTMASLR
eukprot:TRINITY_DN4811_c0_g1_i2.p2 TRINITY_DN4811_c0_g1~~TRINITY_DN4811_c0_g1_i2.p2  ORF type:complete len:110 (+),score=26.33 TRINITY_DN4811_c0_g1_i2:460-789(+)